MSEKHTLDPHRPHRLINTVAGSRLPATRRVSARHDHALQWAITSTAAIIPTRTHTPHPMSSGDGRKGTTRTMKGKEGVWIETEGTKRKKEWTKRQRPTCSASPLTMYGNAPRTYVKNFWAARDGTERTDGTRRPKQISAD